MNPVPLASCLELSVLWISQTSGLNTGQKRGPQVGCGFPEREGRTRHIEALGNVLLPQTWGLFPGHSLSIAHYTLHLWVIQFLVFVLYFTIKRLKNSNKSHLNQLHILKSKQAKAAGGVQWCRPQLVPCRVDTESWMAPGQAQSPGGGAGHLLRAQGGLCGSWARHGEQDLTNQVITAIPGLSFEALPTPRAHCAVALPEQWLLGVCGQSLH